MLGKESKDKYLSSLLPFSLSPSLSPSLSLPSLSSLPPSSNFILYRSTMLNPSLHLSLYSFPGALQGSVLLSAFTYHLRQLRHLVCFPRRLAGGQASDPGQVRCPAGTRPALERLDDLGTHTLPQARVQADMQTHTCVDAYCALKLKKLADEDINSNGIGILM